MENVFHLVGAIVCGIGGSLLCIAVVWFLAWGVSCAWVLFSNQFRAICKAESMIFEYRKYREQFLAWMEIKAGDADA